MSKSNVILGLCLVASIAIATAMISERDRLREELGSAQTRVLERDGLISSLRYAQAHYPQAVGDIVETQQQRRLAEVLVDLQKCEARRDACETPAGLTTTVTDDYRITDTTAWRHTTTTFEPTTTLRKLVNDAKR